MTEPDALTKALEMELVLKRAAWQRAQSRRGTWRALSILFLILVLAGAIASWFHFMPALSRSEEAMPQASANATGSTR